MESNLAYVNTADKLMENRPLFYEAELKGDEGITDFPNITPNFLDTLLVILNFTCLWFVFFLDQLSSNLHVIIIS